MASIATFISAVDDPRTALRAAGIAIGTCTRQRQRGGGTIWVVELKRAPTEGDRSAVDAVAQGTVDWEDVVDTDAAHAEEPGLRRVRLAAERG